MINLPAIPASLQRRRQLLVGVFVLLALLYMLASPIFEVSDEIVHFPVVDYMADTGELPYQDPDNVQVWEQEGSQPPLYYALTALLVSPLDRDDFEERHYRNPHAKIGIGLASDNQNMIVHDPAAEEFPWQGTTLAVMVGRLFSIVLGAGTVWFTFAVAWLALPERPRVALLATALVAFNPMFLFISASVNNDNLVIFLGTLILTVMLSLWRTGWSWPKILVLSILIALASLTKLSGLTFGPVSALAIFLVYRREKRPLKDLLLAAVVMVGALALIAGWWYFRNLQLYGDITGLNVMVDIAGHRPDDFAITDLWDEREGFFYSYWGWFGALNVISPSTFYDLALLICLAGLLGLVIAFLYKPVRWALIQQGAQWPLLLLGFQIIIVFAGVIRWTLQTPASQGRLLFPAIAAISILLALGLDVLLQRGLTLLLIVPLAVYALMLPFIAIIPAYTPPEPIDNLPDDIRLADIRYGVIQLVGYQIEETPVEFSTERDDEITLTLYWQPVQRTAQPLSFYVQVFGPDEAGNLQEIGKLDSYPGQGMRRTDTWETGRVYEETYRIVLNNQVADMTPFQPRFKIGWRNHATNRELLAAVDSPQPLDAITLRPMVEAVILQGGRIFAAEGAECFALQQVGEVRFGEVARLTGYEIGSEGTSTVLAGAYFPLKMRWEVLGQTDNSHTLFIQLIKPDSPTLLRGTGDTIPRAGWYPTSAWIEDTCFVDNYGVYVFSDTPPGNYRLLIGYYDPQTNQRLPVHATNGDRLFADGYLLDIDIIVTSPE